MKKINNIPKEVIDIIKKLNSVPNTTSLIVGGAVRDAIMDKQPNDWDISTNVPIDDIEAMFPTYEIGNNKDFGVVIVDTDIGGIEIAQFRKDGANRKDTDIEIISNFKDDAARRDFTINAMGYDPITDKIYDYFGGVEDIKNKKIRFVGNADQRIKEDALRMIRAIRFSFTKGFEMTNDVIDAIIKNNTSITNISKERILMEINKVIKFNDVNMFNNYIQYIGKIFNIFPKNVYNSFNRKFNIKPANFLVTMFQDADTINLPITKDIMKMIKANNIIKDMEKTAINFFDNVYSSTYKNTTVKTFIINNMGITETDYINMINEFNQYKDIKKTYNGKVIMNQFKVKGSDIKKIQNEICENIFSTNKKLNDIIK